MKPTQLVLLLLGVVALIFGATFATMYVGQSNKPLPPPPKGAALNQALSVEFFQRDYPLDPADSLSFAVTEYGQRGHHDFWFSNPNAEDVRLGLEKASCECAEVKVFIVPDSWRGALAVVAGGSLGASGQDVLSTLLTTRITEAASRDLGGDVKNLGDLPKTGTVIPARALGFVRLSWLAKRGSAGGGVQPVRHLVQLWTQDPNQGNRLALNMGTMFVDGVRVDRDELPIGDLGSRKQERRIVRCWSNTRADFTLDVESSGEPYIVCGPREPLTEDDIAELTRRGTLPVAVRSGYRYPVVVRERADDGSYFDTGAFNHRLTFKPREEMQLSARLEIAVRGYVRSDVVFDGGGQGVTFPTFQAENGATMETALSTERRDINLKVDRMAEFLTAKLSEPRLVGDRKTWTLTVEIGPNKVSGAFPRNEPYLRDSAIYLKVEGAERRMRIPVSGNARAGRK